MKTRTAKKVVKRLGYFGANYKLSTGRTALKVFRRWGKINCDNFLDKAWKYIGEQ